MTARTTSCPRIVVRRATRPDIALLAAVLFPETSAEQVSQRWREDRDGHREAWIAELDGAVAGTVSTGGYGHQMPDSLRLFALDVGPPFRGRGVGTALIEAVEARACVLERPRVNLEVAIENAGAVRLYERLGYQPAGVPETMRWTRMGDDGGSEEIEELSWVMLKRL